MGLSAVKHVPVRVFTEGLSLVCEADSYESLYFTRGWHEAGAFAISLPIGLRDTKEFLRGRIVALGNGVCARYGILTETMKSVSVGEEGKAVCVARGFELSEILKRRIVLPPDGFARFTAQGPAESVIKSLVGSQCGPDAPVARRFPLLAVAADQGRGDRYLASLRYAELGASVAACSKATGLGYRIDVDTDERKFVFDVHEGVDRRAGQCVHPRAIFSFSFDTLSGASLRSSEVLRRSVIFAGGSGMGTARLLSSAYAGSDEPSGFGRKEAFLDARELSDDAVLASAAGMRVRELAQTEFLETELLAGSPLVEGRDFDLGDLCTVAVFGEALDLRITELEERIDSGSYRVFARFGAPYPEAQKVAREDALRLSQALNAMA